jgi:hypothetical protein
MIAANNIPDPGDLSVPPVLWWPSGTPMTIWLPHLTAARSYDAYDWTLALGGNAGVRSGEQWTVTPAADATLSIVQRRCGIQAAASVALRVSSGAVMARKCLLVGDSLCADGRWPDALAALLPTWTFLGQHVSAYAGTHHEGHSGFSFLRYCTDAGSPFVTAGVLNVPAYLAALGDTPDVVVFELGINDMINYTPTNQDAGITAMFARIDELLAAWAAAVPAASLYLVTPPVPNARPEAFGVDYGAAIPRFRWVQVGHYLRRRMLIAYPSRLIPAHLHVDHREWFASTAANSAVHMNATGYAGFPVPIAAALRREFAA